ncbi:MAG: MMPL family transporter [Frankia sp.]
MKTSRDLETDPTGGRPPGRHIAARAAAWSVRHRRLAIIGWLACVVIVVLLGSALGTRQLTDAQSSAGGDKRAQRVLETAGFVDPAAESVLVQRPGPQEEPPLARDAQMRTAVADVVTRVLATGRTGELRAPYGVAGAAREDSQLSRDGRSALVTFTLPGDPDNATDRVAPVLAAVSATAKAHPGLRIEEFGEASAEKALDDTSGNDFQRAELMAVPISLGILLVVFGAVVAALVPVVLALSAFAAALGLLAFASRMWPVDQVATSVMLLIGLAVGVDYALFYLRREREERAKGASAPDALAIAADTSGRAVLTSGLTVAAAMVGLGFTGLGTFTGVAVGTTTVVLIAVLGSLTVLPAVLSALGDNVMRLRLPFLGRSARAGQERQGAAHRPAGRWAARRRGIERDPRRGMFGVLLRRPAIVTGIVGGLLVLLALPALSLKTAAPGIDDIPRNVPIMQVYARVHTAFPGGQTPAVVVVSGTDMTSPGAKAALADLRQRALATGRMYNPITVDVSPSHTVARISVPLAGSGTDTASTDAVKMLRGVVIPAALAPVRSTGMHADVTGMTAASVDFGTQLRHRAPIVVGFVLALAFILLLAAFRGPVVATIAVGLNMLSVGAAYGLLALVFQHHWADGLLGYTSTGTIASWLPLFLFVVLFGLSMDYQVFVLSRIREGIRDGLSPHDAVVYGVRRSAGVVTSAATIMVAVFAIFATLSQVSMKQLGVGLAAAVLLDATVVRVILLPAVLTLVGERAWRRDIEDRALSRPARVKIDNSREIGAKQLT